MSKRPAIVFLLLFGMILPAAAQTPEQLFDRGNAAYEEGRFQEAAEAYRSVLRYGVRDARVEYNLANAEFKLGRLGESILHFQRARLLDPTDEDIAANLELVQSHCIDQVETPELPGPLAWIVALQNHLGPDNQAAIGLAGLWLLGMLVAFFSLRRGGWGPVAGWITVAAVVLLLLIAGSWYMTVERVDRQELAVVLVEAVDVLAGPGENNATLFTVHEGLTVEIRARREEWLQVSLPTGLNGWLPRSVLGRV